MKTFWSVFSKILILVVIVQWWFLYDYGKKNQQIVAENVQLEMDLLKTTDALHASQAKVEEIESRTLEHMVKETNKAVVSGWEQLLNSVATELEKAKGAIHELSKPSEKQPSEKQPSVQKPTEKKSTDQKPSEPAPAEKPAEVIEGSLNTLSEEAKKSANAVIESESPEKLTIEKQTIEKEIQQQTSKEEPSTEAPSLLDKAGAMIDDIKEVFPDLREKAGANTEAQSPEVVPETNSAIPAAPQTDVPSEPAPYPSVEGERT